MSLCQYLSLQDVGYLRILLDKHDIIAMRSEIFPLVEALKTTISSASSEQLLSLLGEIIRTPGDLRTRVTPKYRYDERWDDLVRCLHLDGYKIDDRKLVTGEPTLDGVEPIEDDFSAELKRAGLAEADAILGKMDESANDFCKIPPDYNGCLTNARIALETLVKSIATVRKSASFAEKKWGETLAYLHKSDLISKKEEEGISGVYSFVSQGAHRPVGFTEQEMARLGRSLVASMCYFLVKLHNQQ